MNVNIFLFFKNMIQLNKIQVYGYIFKKMKILNIQFLIQSVLAKLSFSNAFKHLKYVCIERFVTFQFWTYLLTHSRQKLVITNGFVDQNHRASGWRCKRLTDLFTCPSAASREKTEGRGWPQPGAKIKPELPVSERRDGGKSLGHEFLAQRALRKRYDRECSSWRSFLVFKYLPSVFSSYRNIIIFFKATEDHFSHILV